MYQNHNGARLMGDIMETLQNIDSNGNIDTTYYKNAINELIERYIIDFNYDAGKMTSNNLHAVCLQVYNAIFKPDKNQFTNKKSNIPYNKHNIQALINIYLDIAFKYNCLPSMFTFSRLVGIDDETILAYVTDASSQLAKNRQAYIINRLNESSIGVVTLANNEQSIGLMYNRQNIIDHATVKQSLSVNELVKIPQRE